MNITDFFGKRALLKIGHGYNSSVEEYKVLEISPSGNWVKLMRVSYGSKFWRPVSEISFIEELVDLKADKPK